MLNRTSNRFNSVFNGFYFSRFFVVLKNITPV